MYRLRTFQPTVKIIKIQLKSIPSPYLYLICYRIQNITIDTEDGSVFRCYAMPTDKS
jgi:hypothetical protein